MATEMVKSVEDGPRNSEQPRHLEPVAYSVSEVAQVLRIGTTLCRELIKSGELPSVRIGRRLLVPRCAIEEYLSRLLNGQGRS